MLLPSGTLITMRKASPVYLTLPSLRNISWFRPPDYLDSFVENYSDIRDSYGTFKGVYLVSSPLLLLNLGSLLDRQLIAEHTDLTPLEFSPDVQYSGHVGNLRFHQAILDSPSLQRYDGTYISQARVDEALEEDLAGAEEIVLFLPRARSSLALVRIESTFTTDVWRGSLH